MLRLVLQKVHTGDAAHIGGPVTTTLRTFTFELPEAEQCLRNQDQWNSVHVIGVEVIEAARKAGGE